MKINHMAMYVKDLEGCRQFFEKYFGAVANDKYYNAQTGLETYFLTFEGEGRLEIMTKPNLYEPMKNMICTGYVHFAFNVGSREEVDELTMRLKNDGYTVLSRPRATGDGYYESCVLDREGNQIEIME